MYGRMEVCIDVWKYGSMDVWTYGRMDVCIMYVSCMYVSIQERYTCYGRKLHVLSV